MQRYYSKEFEELFEFGICCEYYDENKVIQVDMKKK